MPTTLVFVVIVALFASIPILLDICLAYWAMNDMRKRMLEKASLNGLNIKELREFVEESAKAPPGIPGLARATMALTVLVVLGVALLEMIAEKPPSANSQVVNNVLSMLSGLLAAITGFYFGGRSAQQAAQQAGARMAKSERTAAVGDKPLT